jgi:hypothetical protein
VTADWRYPLTPRHTQLLTLLMSAGPAGLTAAALSTAVYGDEQHDVAIRAEMSRLRRRLGGVLLTRPYRVAPNVAITPGAAGPLSDGTGQPGTVRSAPSPSQDWRRKRSRGNATDVSETRTLDR